MLLLLGLFVFLFIVVSTFTDIYTLMHDARPGFDCEFEGGKHVVTEVAAKGPAQQAGIEIGDTLLVVNGHHLEQAGDLEDLLAEIQIGENIDLTINRHGLEQQFSLVMGRQLTVYRGSIFAQLVPGLIFCYGLSLIGIFVLVKRIQDEMAHIFYAMVMMWALVIWDEFIGFGTLKRILPFWFRDIFLLPAGPLAVSLLFHFHLVFPTEKRVYTRYRKALLLAIYAPVFVIIPHLYATVNNKPWAEFLLDMTWGPWLVLYLVLALVTLAHSVTSATNIAIKKQAQITLWGTCLGLGVPLLFYFFPFVLFKQSLANKQIFLPFFVFWPISLAYAIIKHRFMDIDLIIKRGLAYALISGFVVAAYFLFVVGVGRLVLLITGSTNQLVTILATLIIAALFNPVKNRIQTFVDRKFFPKRFSYREAVRKFRHELVNIVDFEMLQDLLMTFFIKTMGIRTIALLWDTQKNAKFEILKAEGINKEEALSFSSRDKAIEHLQKEQQLLDLSL
ncbi:MAG: PDZ domain-containing protein, partial [bacterium]